LQADYTPVEEKKKQKTKGGKSGELVEEAAAQEADWSQDQQKSLELALLQFPKVKSSAPGHVLSFNICTNCVELLKFRKRHNSVAFTWVLQALTVYNKFEGTMSPAMCAR
jgi:hypothetical protein